MVWQEDFGPKALEVLMFLSTSLRVLLLLILLYFFTPNLWGSSFGWFALWEIQPLEWEGCMKSEGVMEDVLSWEWRLSSCSFVLVFLDAIDRLMSA